MYKTILFIAFLLPGASLCGQTTFHKNFQGGIALSTTALDGGGVLEGGYQPQFFQPNQGLLVRLNNLGEVLWRKRFPSMAYIRDAIKIGDEIIITGDTIKKSASLPEPRFGLVSKLSLDGNIIWAKKIGNVVGGTFVNQVLAVPNGYLIAGQYGSFGVSVNSGSFLARIDQDGNTVWSKIYSIDHPTPVYNLVGQYIEADTLHICGNIQGNGALLRININTGEILSVSTYGGVYIDELSSMRPTQDGNFVLAGYTRSTTGSEESRPWVLKVNRAGQILWSKTYNLLGTSLVCQMTEAGDGGFVLSMGGDNIYSYTYAVLAKIDASGNLLWAYNYSGGQDYGLGEITQATDGGFIVSGGARLLKTDGFGHLGNGCCPALINFQVENYMPGIQHPGLISAAWENTLPFAMAVVNDNGFSVSNFCDVEITSLNEQIPVCQGDSIQIKGHFYQAPNVVRDTILNLTGGCDTVRVYNLLPIPMPIRIETVSFCPGTSVLINGVSHTEPDTFTQILPATVGCDTLLVYFLQWSPLPKKYETTTFCPGETVFFDGVGYHYPGIIPFPDTLQGPPNGCDTLLFQKLAYPVESSVISLQCPPDILVSTSPGTVPQVDYPLPTATSDCSCPDLYIPLEQGLPSGAAFPVGSTQVCYSASDVCGDYKTCCFEVNVEEYEACDIKEAACIRYELLGISVDAEQNKTYRLRVTNHCTSPLLYTVIQIPNGVEALAPAQSSTFVSTGNREYQVRNPNYSPFRSVRFKPLEMGIAGEQSDVFEYTLPAQASPNFIRAATRLASGQIYEATLNTFGCTVQTNTATNRTANQVRSAAAIQLFPNPNKGELFVDMSAWGNGIAQLRVLNIHGQELTKTSLPTGLGMQSFQIPSILPNGLYFLEISAANGERQTVKFVLRW